MKRKYPDSAMARKPRLLQAKLSLGPSTSIAAASSKKIDCPICSSSVLADIINIHIDNCIKRAADRENAPASKESSFSSSPLVSIERLEEIEQQPGALISKTKVNDDTNSPDLFNSRSQQTIFANVPKANVFAEMMKSSKESAPRHAVFKLDLNKSGKLVPIFTFLSETKVHDSRDDMVAWTSTIRMKNFAHQELILTLKSNICSSTHSSFYPSSSTGSDIGENPISIAVVKSMLQKAVRRRRQSAACRLAYELYRISPTELLRRLPIIIIEDSALHPSYPVLVWLMLAVSKGFHPPPSLVAFVLQLTIDTALVRTRDYAGFAENVAIETNMIDIARLPQGIGRDLVASLLLRASFGGMPGDMEMLSQAALSWFNRFLGEEDTLNICSVELRPSTELSFSFYLDDSYIFPLRSTSWGMTLLNRFSKDEICMEQEFIEMVFNSEDPKHAEMLFAKELCLRQIDIIPEGIDFHCDWNLVPFIFDRIEQSLDLKLDEERIKFLIWTYRSSTNNHRFEDQDGPAALRQLSEQLVEKKSCAKEWSIICPLVVDYCNSKCEILWRRYSRK